MTRPRRRAGIAVAAADARGFARDPGALLMAVHGESTGKPVPQIADP